MRNARFIATLLALSATSAISHAQKPSKTGYSHAAGKGTPASLPRHSDTSALVLQKSPHGGAAADLSRIEQQSLHSPANGTQSARVRPAYVAKPALTKGKQSVPINFSGHSPAANKMVTKTAGRGPGSSIPKPH